MGDGIHFSLEARIFHSVCIALVVGIGVNIPIAAYMGIMPLVILLTIVVLTAILLYYFSRFQGMYSLVAGIFQVFVNIAVAANYYYNSGINGPTYTIAMLAFMVIVVTVPARQYYIWLPLNILVVVSLVTLEFMIPGWVTVTYSDARSRYIDMVASYVIIAGFAFLVTVFVKNAYNVQRSKLVNKSKDLEAANVTKNKLLSILGHDLKEPLASLQVYLELLSDAALDEDEKKMIQSQILLVTKNASAILSNVLAWSRGQMHSFQAEKQALSLLEVLKPVVDLAGGISREKNISFSIDIPATAIIQADRRMLELIIRNLLTNAVKFTPAGGAICLSAHFTETECVLCVRDNGVGIAPELQPDIFTLGVKSVAGTRNEKGAGLGLVLCHEFAQLQQGRLSFESKLNEGTSFFLSLPHTQVNPAQGKLVRPFEEAASDLL